MKLSQKAERILDLPQGALTGEAHIEIEGKERLTVDGDCEVTEYEDTFVRLRTRSGEVRVTGDGLNLEHLRAKGVSLAGRLLSVEFL